MTASGRSEDAARWNHNIHFHGFVLASIPAGTPAVLDVGCGEGMLARRIRERAERVIAIDNNAPSIELARARDPEGAIEYVLGDFRTYPFAPESFDVIAAVASLHHMGAADALERMRALLRPGGRLVIVGLARSTRVRDLVADAASAVASRMYRRTKVFRRARSFSRTKIYWEPSSPTVWPPPVTYAEMRALIERVLPHAYYRRRLLFRYTVSWTKPDRP